MITGARISAPTGAGRGSRSRCSRSTSGPSRPDRSQPGHWKGDLIIGKGQRSAVGTLVERQTRMIRLLHLRQRDGDTVHDALTARMADLPAALLRPITWEQGTEMARLLTIARSLGAPIYFCDSRSP